MVSNKNNNGKRNNNKKEVNDSFNSWKKSFSKKEIISYKKDNKKESMEMIVNKPLNNFEGEQWENGHRFFLTIDSHGNDEGKGYSRISLRHETNCPKCSSKD